MLEKLNSANKSPGKKKYQSNHTLYKQKKIDIFKI